LFAREERVGSGDVDGAPHADVHAVEGSFVAHDEFAVAIEEVGVSWRDKHIVRKNKLTLSTDDVLFGFEVEAQAIHAFTTNEDQLGFCGVLHVPEKQCLRVEDLERNAGPAPPAELVTRGHAART